MLENDKFRDFFSGLIAGFISVTVCNPLDIARTRLNIMSSPNHSGNKYINFSHALKVIWEQEGLKGFYAGYKINAKAIPIFHSMFFPIYETTKQYFANKGYSRWQQYIYSTIIAGSMVNIITNPIWVIRTRIMVQALHHIDYHYTSNSIWKIANQIVKQEGVSSLFRGLSASLFGVSNAIIYFFIYQNCKFWIKEYQNNVFNSYYVFGSSILSKFVASTICYPFIVIRTIMHDHRKEDKISFLTVCKHIYYQRGIKGFYGGLKPDLLRLLPSNTIVFLVYEKMKRIFEENAKKNRI